MDFLNHHQPIRKEINELFTMFDPNQWTYPTNSSLDPLVHDLPDAFASCRALG